MRRRLLTACACLAACGYSAGYATPVHGRTIALDVVANDSWWQRREIPLTRAIIEALAIHADVRVADSDHADALLEVAIEDITRRTLVLGTNAPLREGDVGITAHVVLRDRPTGAVLREARIIDRAEYRIPVGETLAGAELEATTDLARRIVLALEQDF